VGRSHPAPLLFILHVTPHRAVSGQVLTVGVRTVPQAHVTIILRVLARRVVYRGSGQQRRRLVKLVALYTVQVQGTANSKGRFTRSLKITYQPRKPVQALLAASARMGRRTATRTTHVTILPQRHQQKVMGAVVQAAGSATIRDDAGLFTAAGRSAIERAAEQNNVRAVVITNNQGFPSPRAWHA
jgi:hypothetical protein